MAPTLRFFQLKRYMRLFLFYILFTVGIYSCNSGEKRTATSSSTDSTIINNATDGVNDGTNNNGGNNGNPGNNDTTAPPVKDTVPKQDPELSMADKALLGRHNLTLQWIGWNVPGLAIIEAGKDGWYTIKGKQETKAGYLLIDGKLRPVFENVEDAVEELEFNGVIEYKYETINGGAPCSKSGKQKFLSTQGRKYWRLQNMINCDKTTTDYVDIYFK
jgi:hypothetical protein